MSDATERARRLREKRARIAARGELHLVAGPDRVDALLAPEDGADARAAEVSEARRIRFEGEDLDLDPRALVAELREGLEAARQEAFVHSLRRTVLDAVTRPFGLGGVLALADRRGGHVLTRHNAERARLEGWGHETADPDRVAAYDARRRGIDYDRKDYEQGFPERRKTRFKDDTPLVDAYTGKDLQRDGSTHLDHVVSAKELHTREDAAFHLSKEQTRDLAVDDENLAFTDSSLNQSKGEHDLDVWKTRLDKKTGGTKGERFGLDDERAGARNAQARDHVKQKVRRQAVVNTGKDMAKAAAGQAAGMAIQEALGLLLLEFADGCFDALAALWADRHTERSFGEWLGELGRAVQGVAARVAAKKGQALDALGEGAASGLLSSLATSIANLFLSTGKRLVRILREGIHSILKAIRLLVSRPEGMTRDQAFHAATKLFAGALAVAVGIGIEELVEKALASVPFLAPFANLLSNVTVGLATGLATAALVREIDRLDLIGVQADGEREGVLALLEARIEETLTALEAAPVLA